MLAGVTERVGCRAIDTLDREAAATGLAPVTEAPARPAARSSARTTARPFRIPAGGEAGTPVELVSGDGVVGSDARADVRLLVAHRATGELAPPPVRRPARARCGPATCSWSTRRPSSRPPSRRWDPTAGSCGLHLSTEQPGGYWVVEPRRRAGVGTARYEGDPPALAGPGRRRPGDPARPIPRRCRLAAAVGGAARSARAARALPHRWGRPIAYPYVRRDGWPIEAYQTVYAGEPGSAEMPSTAAGIHRGRSRRGAARPRRRAWRR